MNTDKALNLVSAMELRIGNLILDEDGEVLPIIGITKTRVFHPNNIFSEIETVRGVPLNEEWLLKLGFKKGSGCSYSPGNPADRTDEYEIEGLEFYGEFHFEVLTGVGYFYFVDTSEYNDVSCSITPEIKYVHTLQNTFFALTNTELKLK